MIDESTIFARVIAPEDRMEPSAAAEFLKWGFSDADRERMSELAAKARQGTLTPQEQATTECQLALQTIPPVGASNDTSER